MFIWAYPRALASRCISSVAMVLDVDTLAVFFVKLLSCSLRIRSCLRVDGFCFAPNENLLDRLIFEPICTMCLNPSVYTFAYPKVSVGTFSILGLVSESPGSFMIFQFVLASFGVCFASFACVSLSSSSRRNGLYGLIIELLSHGSFHI